jgi:NADPH:quinone reductase-like Zn-dependent oxidoreductase
MATAGPEALAVRETADPEPGPGQVRIRVRTAGLNFAEVMAAQGLYPDAPKPPCVLGYEVAGVIDALGAGTQGHGAGQRVLALTRFGGHADVVCVPAEQVLAMPDAMSFEEAAALPVNYLTAYHMLFRVAGVRAAPVWPAGGLRVRQPGQRAAAAPGPPDLPGGWHTAADTAGADEPQPDRLRCQHRRRPPGCSR